ncbi:MAG: hypothetical protein HN742_26385 [Lentisphaerae bacterium]|jgi:hypothetical protein|nr:hypothetical protein [Lentisphaerota bacterium]MBT4820298.1 hypothetical protein [Lentisphaerota bacterium]MBT5605991.1 hypothetical protein [Lentisphaerota bacterium]MBT7058620.1 hypothetical protein [Lentisphaerota bacterium]MBT7845430.1 hypothetical protein [Lentisphaerota bacterium]
MAQASDTEILTAIADHRVLTVEQIAALPLHMSSPAAVNRRIRLLEPSGWIARGQVSLSGRRGRPKSILSITSAGVSRLKKDGVLREDVPADKVTADSLQASIHHELLLNSFRGELLRLQADTTELKATFFSAKSPFNLGERGTSLLADAVPTKPRGGDKRCFTPDGAFALTHEEAGRSLLFFVEIDMGTEPLVSQAPDTSDIAGKVTNYRTYLGTKGYKRHEKTFATSLNGFRVLFVTNTSKRRAQICKTVAGLPPSDFVWVTDQDRLFKHGPAGGIWHRGGRTDGASGSIMGNQHRASGK